MVARTSPRSEWLAIELMSAIPRERKSDFEPVKPRWRKVVLLSLLTVAVVVGGLVAAWRLSGSRSMQLFGELVSSIPVAESIVALTFDDGPVPIYTDSVLTVLRQEDVRATFFVTGNSVARSPDLARRTLREGHELGNHSLCEVDARGVIGQSFMTLDVPGISWEFAAIFMDSTGAAAYANVPGLSSVVSNAPGLREVAGARERSPSGGRVRERACMRYRFLRSCV